MDKPVFNTVRHVQEGAHYASHIDQPIRRMPMDLVTEQVMEDLLRCAEPATCRGVPSSFNYKDGVIRVWPWPAEGWQVWSEVSAKEVTP